MPIEEIFLWVEKNITYEYKDEELEKAYHYLSMADVFRGRIYRQQHWRFLSYENIFLSAGISSSKKEKKHGFTAYQRPTRILKIWLNNQKNAKKKSIAEKYSKLVHIGRKRAMKDFFLLPLIINTKEKADRLKLSEEEFAFLQEKRNAINLPVAKPQGV